MVLVSVVNLFWIWALNIVSTIKFYQITYDKLWKSNFILTICVILVQKNFHLSQRKYFGKKFMKKFNLCIPVNFYQCLHSTLLNAKLFHSGKLHHRLLYQSSETNPENTKLLLVFSLSQIIMDNLDT